MTTRSSAGLREQVLFIEGKYQELVDKGTSGAQLLARLVLGLEPTEELERQYAGNETDNHIYRAARAFEAGALPLAHEEIAALWKIFDARVAAGAIDDHTYYNLRQLGDVMLCAAATDEVRKLVEFLASRSHEHPVRGYVRLSTLAAPLVGDRTWIVRQQSSDRERVLADAIEAEMSGDRSKAVTLLQSIVNDPSPYWEYPERMALLRNLRALHRTREAQALCDDTTKPALFQPAYLPARRVCLGK
jgi:hypothetical protein